MVAAGMDGDGEKMIYQEFISRKLADWQPVGFDYTGELGGGLFDHQESLVRWAIRLGRSAIFADTGLGKTRMQVEWADIVSRHANGNILILAPLAVAEQTVEEASSIGVKVTHVRDQSDVDPAENCGIFITNYDRMHRFDASRFIGIVLDESSIIKHHDAKTLQMLLDAFSDTPYRLCATATPAPNDWTELGTHAEFLGICTRAEMLSEYFVHDGGETQVWRLKGHARQAFWRWVSSWGAMIRSPSDLGFDASAYELPPLVVNQVTVGTDAQANDGMLFALEASTLSERRQARKDSLRQRVAACADRVNSTDGAWIIWCELNAEADALREAIPEAVEIRGSDTADRKERALYDFSHGNTRVLITKPKIAGFGLNWQHCRNVAFVGVTDSFESYYQAVRRCWRFGQAMPVNVWLYVSELEGSVLANLQRKERDALAMFEQLSAETKDAVRAAVLGSRRETNAYNAVHRVKVPHFIGANL